MYFSLDKLNDDILIIIFSIFSIPDILAFRQVCKRFALISEQRIVWHNAYTTQILQQNIPFTSQPLPSLSDKQLEKLVRRAESLGRRWRSSLSEPRCAISSHIGKGAPVEEVRFIPGHDGQWVVTVSKGIWSKLTLWNCFDLAPVAMWAPDKALFDGIAVNTEFQSSALLAISILQNGSHRVEILTIRDAEHIGNLRFESIFSLDTMHKPVALRGDLLALADIQTETILWNWRTQAYATLRSEGIESWRDKCIQVVFSSNSIVVVRSRSVHLFPDPVLAAHPNDNIYFSLASHTFGWVDGVSASLGTTFLERTSSEASVIQPLSILVRLKGDDPWSTRYKIQLWSICPNPTYSRSAETADFNPSSICPYTFPPTLMHEILSPHFGPLQCGNMVLGPYGTAVWIQPADWAVAGLISDAVHLQRMPVPTSHESLVAALFPGALGLDASNGIIKMSWSKEDNDSWTCLDYDEGLGRIALGSQSGSISVLEI
ncbi:hypothetical protein BJ138DRAFT_1099327 [Hygrophoropsis aurantiaca]|uniref:Uncharacterized protein n=1 Tax=Hygrophoropsis aurantiaca TaxID=72124 RepID=A0ACB8AK68_9AGAM|nr:hypothetical protein BJ138DRAFT_1099327 [Hygrophoropsis aurantiaca]